MNNELLPCPFCGGKVRPAVERPMGHGDMESRIVCHCGLKYTSNAPCEAIERCWNRRHKPALEQAAASTISATEFVAGYCERSGITKSEFYQSQVPMPDPTSPCGWAAISNNPLAIKAHCEINLSSFDEVGNDQSETADKGQGEPVAWAMKPGLDRISVNPKASHAVFGHSGEPGWDVPLYAEPVAPVAVVPEKYDDVLLPFLSLMRAELHANARKGDRPGWLQMDRKTAVLEVFYHMGKLHMAVHRNDKACIKEYAADVANMCMMLTDVCGCLNSEPKP